MWTKKIKLKAHLGYMIVTRTENASDTMKKLKSILTSFKNKKLSNA